MDTYSLDDGPSKKTRLLLVGIVVAALVISLAGGLLSNFVYHVYQEGQKIAAALQQLANEIELAGSTEQAFANDLAAGRADSAYERTTRGYQQRVTRQEFRIFVDMQRFSKIGSSNVTGTSTSSEEWPLRFSSHYTIQIEHEERSYTIELIKEDRVWKIDQVTVPSL